MKKDTRRMFWVIGIIAASLVIMNKDKIQCGLDNLCGTSSSCWFFCFKGQNNILEPPVVCPAEKIGTSYIYSNSYDSGICTAQIVNCYDEPKRFRVFVYSLYRLDAYAGASYVDMYDVEPNVLTDVSLDCSFFTKEIYGYPIEERYNWMIIANWDMYQYSGGLYSWSDPDMIYGNFDASKVDWEWTCREFHDPCRIDCIRSSEGAHVIIGCPDDYVEMVS